LSGGFPSIAFNALDVHTSNTIQAVALAQSLIRLQRQEREAAG
jgi:hypothetical protein